MMRAVFASLAGGVMVFVALAPTARIPPAYGQAGDCLPGIITTVAGSGEEGYSGDGGPAAQAGLALPTGVAMGPHGCLYLADMSNHRIRKVCDGRIATAAGKGTPGYSGDGGPAAQASLNEPRGCAVGADGSLYIADSMNNRIAKVDAAGVITTVAGDGAAGYAGDGGPAVEARLQHPYGVAVGADGSLYVADTKNHRIRKVDPAGIITTAAGRSGRGRYYGDGGPAAEARLNEPYGVAVGAGGSLYIADTLNHRIRKIDPDGIISTVAGDGVRRYGGDGGPAVKAGLNSPTAVAVAVGADGSLYIADMNNRRLRKVDPDGVITTVAGTGGAGHWGDGGPATEAAVGRPRAVAVGADGSLYFADAENHRIRQVRWLPCDPEAARTMADDLRAQAGESPDAWREAAQLYLILQAYDDALAAAERLLAVTPEADQPARMRAEVLIARVYAGKRDDHEARRRLIRVLARARDPLVLRDAGDALASLYLLRGERNQAIATLEDLTLRTKDRSVLNWVNRRLKEIAGG